MKSTRFDRWEFLNILSIVDTNPLEAKIRYEEYLKKYPKDYSAYSYYAAVLIMIGEFEAAEKIMDYVEQISKKDQNFNKDLKKIQNLTENFIFVKLKLLMYQEKYEDACKMIKNNQDIVNKYGLNHVDFYCWKKLGLITNDINIHTYLFNQITNYDEEIFLEHIKKHMADYTAEVDEISVSIFKSQFPIKEIIEEVKKHLSSAKRTFPGFYDDVFYFKYDNCGRVNNKIVDYFKVVCFHNTKDFITIYPITECQNLQYTDLNYLVKEDKTNTKRLSQIDKFNQRYKRN